MLPVIAISIPAPPERHDELVRTRVAPVIRAFREAPAPALVWFERANKPDWSLRVLASGPPAWVEAEARPGLSDRFGVATGEARFVDEPLHDKWTGGLALAGRLDGFLRADACAALDALDADARGALGSRATFSMLVVEGLLDALEVRDDRRLAFDRENFEWAIASGRWDREVLESLERTFASQRASLVALASEERRTHWPTADAVEIGEDLVAKVCAWARASGADAALALPAARGHSNRLGIHGGKEAALRYLMWRARGGHVPVPA